MFVVSGAFTHQLDLVQKDRWSLGPLELVHLPLDGADHVEATVHVHTWNGTLRACTARSGKAVQFFETRWPALARSKNPNLVMVPQVGRYTELHAMLASVVPKAVLEAHGIRKRRANFHLLPWVSDGDDSSEPDAYARGAEQAFSEYIWPRLVRRSGIRRTDFSPKSSLRLVADDSAFWMNRLYRVAVARADAFPECSEQGEDWEPLGEIESKIRSAYPDCDWSKFEFRRPLKGGDLWFPDDQDECDAVIDEAIEGGGIMDSMTPLLETLLSNRVHDDFSDRYSWVKEDFERTFYHKRSKLKISVVETVDDAPAWNVAQPEGYERVLFRDLLSFLNLEDRHLLIALRHGRTVSEIARTNGHRSHASMSRRIKQLRGRLQRLLS